MSGRAVRVAGRRGDRHELGWGVESVIDKAKCRLAALLAGYCNLVKPQYGPDWQLRTQLTLIF